MSVCVVDLFWHIYEQHYKRQFANNFILNIFDHSQFKLIGMENFDAMLIIGTSCIVYHMKRKWNFKIFL